MLDEKVSESSKKAMISALISGIFGKKADDLSVEISAHPKEKDSENSVILKQESSEISKALNSKDTGNLAILNTKDNENSATTKASENENSATSNLNEATNLVISNLSEAENLATLNSQNNANSTTLNTKSTANSTSPKLKELDSCDESSGLALPNLPNDEDFELLAGFFAVFSDPTRLKIISALSKNELCVHELTELLAMKQPSISQHLKVLWQARVVRRRKVGLHAFYRCDDEHIEKIYSWGYEHVKE